MPHPKLSQAFKDHVMPYSAYPSFGFEKPNMPGLQMMCKSCGAALQGMKMARKHIRLNFWFKEMTCKPNTRPQHARLKWFKNVAKKHVQECPICLDDHLLLPVCSNGHRMCLPCKKSIAKAGFSKCPMCQVQMTP